MSNPVNDFLGFGLVQPFRRDQNSDFAAAGGVELVRSCVQQVLGTQCAGQGVQGELEWRTAFGCLLYRLRHANNDDVRRELAYHYVKEALQRWEPRLVVTDVVVESKVLVPGRSPAMVVTVFYDVIKANVDGNNVHLGSDHVSVTA